MEENKKNNKKLIIIGIVIALVVVAVVFATQTKEFKYKWASELLKNKNYDGALNIFKDLEDYKDSKDRLKEAKIGYGKEHTGTMSGFISWKYNNFVGNRGDTGAKIFAINLEMHESIDSLIDVNATQGTNGVWISTTDGKGNYKIDKMPCGNYAIFIVSNNANGNYPEYNALDSVISQKEWLTIQTINNKTFIRSIKYYNNIQINENEETTLSYDFGLTKW